MQEASLLFSSHNNTLLNDITLSNVSSALNRSKLLLNQITKQKENPIVDKDKYDDQKSSIYVQFKIDTNRYVDDESDLVELLRSYSKTCAEYSGFLKERLQHLNVHRHKDAYNSTQFEHDEIEREKHLWRLLEQLFVDGVKSANRDDYDDEMVAADDDDDIENKDLARDDDESAMSGGGGGGSNEATIVKRLERTHPLLRRIRVVIEWLECIARESDYLKSIRESMSAFPERCANWENTLHYLKSANSSSKKDKAALFSGREFITDLDPDAPMRQNKSLHDLDQEDEYKIMEYVFAFIRAGDLDTAKQFLFKIGQSWRAATLEGFRLYQDNNYTRSSSGRLTTATTTSHQRSHQQEVFKNEGNYNRDIWRLMVYKLIKDEHFGPYEKAVYASLAGFVSPILPVCKNYMDFIWAYFKGLYSKIIDRELRQKITVRDYINMPYDPNEDQLFLSISGKSGEQSNLPTISQIFDRIRVLVNSLGTAAAATGMATMSSGSGGDYFGGGGVNSNAKMVSALKADLNRPYSIILKYVIGSGIEGFRAGTNELMDYLKTALIEEKQNGFLLRLAAHLAIFYRAASFNLKDDSFIQIVDTYSQYLIQNSYKEIIAYYLSHLPTDIQIKRYSKFLQTIEDNKERLLLIKLAKERNMNVQAITLNIVDALSKHSITTGSHSSKREDAANVDGAAAAATEQDDGKLLFLGVAASRQQQTQLSDDDRTKIGAIEWIMYEPQQRLKLLEYANLTMRYFMLERKNFEAARLVFAKIPADTVAGILGQYNYQHNTSSIVQAAQTAPTDSNLNAAIENLPNKVCNSIKEYLCFKEYIDSIKLYNEWFEYFHKEKPQKPLASSNSMGFDVDANTSTTTTQSDRTFAERMTQDFQLKQYDDLVARWHAKAVLYCERAKAKFMSVLKFPHGGWMCDLRRNNNNNNNDDDQDDEENMSSDEDDVDDDEDENMDGDEYGQQKRHESDQQARQNRQVQLGGLRRLYLPNMCFVLVDMLAKMGLNKELIKLSALVAAKQYKLFDLFEQEQMRCFLNKIADSSISLIDSNVDYLGYN